VAPNITFLGSAETTALSLVLLGAGLAAVVDAGLVAFANEAVGLEAALATLLGGMLIVFRGLR
jgi:hypothetical protein